MYYSFHQECYVFILLFFFFLNMITMIYNNCQQMSVSQLQNYIKPQVIYNFLMIKVNIIYTL